VVVISHGSSTREPRRGPRAFLAACRDSGTTRPDLIEDITNAEDMHLLPGTHWVLASNMGDRTWKSGGFYAIDTRDRTVQALTPDFSQPPAAPFDSCTVPPAQDTYSSHGLDVRQVGPNHFLLAAVNHGGRESVEVFHVDTTGHTPVMTWRGCVLLHEQMVGNAVAWLGEDELLVTVPATEATLGTLVRAVRGRPTGYAMRWSRTSSWQPVPGTELSITNGLVVSKDHSAIFVNGYADHTVNKVALDGSGIIASTVVDFMPDNLRYAPDGSLLTAGHSASFLTIQLLVNSTAMPVCPVTTKVAQVDPESMSAREVYSRPAGDGFGGGTSAIVVGDDLWVCSFRSRRLAVVPLDATGVRLGPLRR
jgi:hypothetical protein